MAKDAQDAIVLFNSPGGNLFAGIGIGLEIRANGFATLVPQGLECASACAIAWLGGVARFMEDGSAIGFHAARDARASDCVPDSAANAIVGAYLNQLGLSTKAVIYITEASPCDIQWLSFRDAADLGIDVQDWGAEAVASDSGPPASDDLAGPQGGSWVQLFSRQSEGEATALAGHYERRLGQPVSVWRTSNGWYVVALGPYPRDTARAMLYGMLGAGLIPQDSLISGGSGYAKMIRGGEPVGAQAASPVDRANADTYRVTGVASNDVLFIRSGPGTDYSVVAAIPPDGHDISVAACSTYDSYAHKWCQASWDGHSGWVSAGYMAHERTGLPPE